MVEDGEKIGAWEKNGHLTVQSVMNFSDANDINRFDSMSFTTP